MKKVVSIVLMVVAVFTLTACNSSKLDKTGEDFKDEIIKEESYKDLNKEENFSFLIYKDNDTKRYLADVWVPADNKSSILERFYFYDEDKRLDSTESKVTFDDMKANGNYEVVYKSGKFR
ncbi:hypothetical protein [Enterococcus faecalis]|uniref:hypothetical protein n=1 Tax=Enterococcus faecalis TaxID=1351 RepID=UPI0019EDD6F5|nr:hypothetical protein [Enterococcus faecalis]